jgi:hypothetical protein
LTSLLESGHRKEVAKMGKHTWLALSDGKVVVVLEKEPLQAAYGAYKAGLFREAALAISATGAGVFFGASAIDGLVAFEEGNDLDFLTFPFQEGQAVLMLGLRPDEEEGAHVMPVGVLTAGKKWEVEILLVRDSWFA